MAALGGSALGVESVLVSAVLVALAAPLCARISQRLLGRLSRFAIGC